MRSYGNAKLLKEDIVKDNNGQSGVYRWVNHLNGKTYVGSGLNLTKRLGSYFNHNELNRNSRPIQHALLKYGHENFTLEIVLSSNCLIESSFIWICSFQTITS